MVRNRKAVEVALSLTYGNLSHLRQKYEPLRKSCGPQYEKQSDSTSLVFRLEAFKKRAQVHDSWVITEEPAQPDRPGGTLDLRGVPLTLPERRWTDIVEPQDGPDDFYERCFAPHVIEGQRQAFVEGRPGLGSHTYSCGRSRT